MSRLKYQCDKNAQATFLSSGHIQNTCKFSKGINLREAALTKFTLIVDEVQKKRSHKLEKIYLKNDHNAQNTCTSSDLEQNVSKR